jgi:hypothetical protein
MQRSKVVAVSGFRSPPSLSLSGSCFRKRHRREKWGEALITSHSPTPSPLAGIATAPATRSSRFAACDPPDRRSHRASLVSSPVVWKLPGPGRHSTPGLGARRLAFGMPASRPEILLGEPYGQAVFRSAPLRSRLVSNGFELSFVLRLFRSCECRPARFALAVGFGSAVCPANAREPA